MTEMLQKSALLKKLRAIPQEKRLKIIVIIGLLAICGIFFSESFATQKSPAAQTAKTEQTADLDEYIDDVQTRLKKILCTIDGIGECQVMVTLESSGESVYSSDLETQSQSGDNTNSSSQKNKYVILDDDGQKPLLEKEIAPTIRGVIVVCEGAEDVYVRQAVIDCIRAGLGVNSSNISVVKGGKNG